MTLTMSLGEAQRKLVRLPDDFAQDSDLAVVAIMQPDESVPSLAIVPWEQYIAMVEIVDILYARKRQSTELFHDIFDGEVLD
jgi:hypothetical protein